MAIAGPGFRVMWSFNDGPERLMATIESVEPEVSTLESIVRVRLLDSPQLIRLRIPGPATYGAVLAAVEALYNDRGSEPPTPRSAP